MLHLLQQNNKLLENYGYILFDFWDGITRGLDVVVHRHYDHHPELAKQCLQLINTLDYHPPTNADEETFATWARAFPVDESFYPDNVVTALSSFLPPEDAMFCHRVRRLRILKDDHPDTPAIVEKADTPNENGNSLHTVERSQSHHDSDSATHSSLRSASPGQESANAHAAGQTISPQQDPQSREAGGDDPHINLMDSTSMHETPVVVDEGSEEEDDQGGEGRILSPSPTETAVPEHEVANP